MRPRYIFMTLSLVTMIAVFLVLRLAGFLPHSTVGPANPPLDPLKTVEPGVVQVDAGALQPATTEPVRSPETPLQDGLAILESTCTQCHTAQRLAKIKKPRADWEKTLAQMEALGVRLEESEKVVLLDYLASADKP